MGANEYSYVVLTQEEQDLFLLTQMELKSKESDDYKHGFENVVLEVHIQYNLRRKKNNDNSNKKYLNNSRKKTLEFGPKKIAESSKRNENNAKKRNTSNITKKTVDVSTKSIQTGMPTTSKQDEIITRTIADKIDF